MATHSLPVPVRFLTTAWAAVRGVPGIWFARGLLEAASYIFRLAVLFAVGLLLVIHFGAHLKAGLPIVAWPGALLATIARPGVIVGLGGTAFVSWLILFSMEAAVFGGIWSATKEALVGEDVRPWRSVWRGAMDSFPRALAVRLLVRASELALLSMIIGSLVLFAASVDFVAARISDSIIARSLTWAILLTVGTSAAVLLRLTAEMVAAAVFVDDVGLGEGILRAANTVVAHPIYVYRLFIVSASVLIVPLVFAWAVALAQNLFLIAPGTEMVAWALRFGAEVLVLIGIAAFSVMLHATFFAYYAWDHHRLETTRMPPQSKSKAVVSLADLLPAKYDHIASVDEVLAPWTSDEILPVDHSDLPPAEAAVTGGSFDLNAILVGSQEEE